MKSSKLQRSLALSLPLVAANSMATELAVKVQLPKLDTAEYHKPYVAFWIEKGDHSFSNNLGVWYNPPKGDKWLKDVRQWWRQSGRDLTLPLDGLSSPTRGPGEYDLKFASGEIDKLPAGEYQLVVEAAREHGGREVVRVPFQLPAKAGQIYSGKGTEELGAVSLQLKR
jgi:hypothetical protein